MCVFGVLLFETPPKQPSESQCTVNKIYLHKARNSSVFIFDGHQSVQNILPYANMRAFHSHANGYVLCMFVCVVLYSFVCVCLRTLKKRFNTIRTSNVYGYSSCFYWCRLKLVWVLLPISNGFQPDTNWFSINISCIVIAAVAGDIIVIGFQVKFNISLGKVLKNNNLERDRVNRSSHGGVCGIEKGAYSARI